MESRFLLAAASILLCGVVDPGLGLQCYTCNHFVMSHDHPLVNSLLESLNKPNKNCEQGTLGGVRGAAVTCRADSSVCVKVDVRFEAVSGGESIDVYQVTRGCGVPPKGATAQQDACGPLTDIQRQLEEELTEGVVQIAGDLKGQQCRCYGDRCNGARGHLAIATVVLLVGLLISALV